MLSYMVYIILYLFGMWGRPTDNMLLIPCHIFCNDQEPQQRLRRVPSCSHGWQCLITLYLSLQVSLMSSVFSSFCRFFNILIPNVYTYIYIYIYILYGNCNRIMSLSCPCCTQYPSSKALIRSQCVMVFLRPDVPDWLTDIFTGSSVWVSASGKEVWLLYIGIGLLQHHQSALCNILSVATSLQWLS